MLLRGSIARYRRNNLRPPRSNADSRRSIVLRSSSSVVRAGGRSVFSHKDRRPHPQISAQRRVKIQGLLQLMPVDREQTAERACRPSAKPEGGELRMNWMRDACLLVLVGLLALSGWPVVAQSTGSYQQVGNFGYGQLPNGTTYTDNKVGNFTYRNYSDGTSATANKVGNFTYTNYSDGSSAVRNRVGNTDYTRYSDGTTYTTQHIGNMSYTSGSDGSSETGQRLGNASYYNYSQPPERAANPSSVQEPALPSLPSIQAIPSIPSIPAIPSLPALPELGTSPTTPMAPDAQEDTAVTATGDSPSASDTATSEE